MFGCLSIPTCMCERLCLRLCVCQRLRHISQLIEELSSLFAGHGVVPLESFLLDETSPAITRMLADAKVKGLEAERAVDSVVDEDREQEGDEDTRAKGVMGEDGVEAEGQEQQEEEEEEEEGGGGGGRRRRRR